MPTEDLVGAGREIQDQDLLGKTLKPSLEGRRVPAPTPN